MSSDDQKTWGEFVAMSLVKWVTLVSIGAAALVLYFGVIR